MVAVTPTREDAALRHVRDEDELNRALWMALVAALISAQNAQ